MQFPRTNFIAAYESGLHIKLEVSLVLLQKFIITFYFVFYDFLNNKLWSLLSFENVACILITLVNINDLNRTYVNN